MNESVRWETKKLELRKHASHTLGFTTKQTRNTYRRRGGQHPRNPQVWWASARFRHDDNPTDTQADTKSRSPHQGAANHCLTSRRRRCSEEVAEAMVILEIKLSFCNVQMSGRHNLRHLVLLVELRATSFRSKQPTFWDDFAQCDIGTCTAIGILSTQGIVEVS